MDLLRFGAAVARLQAYELTGDDRYLRTDPDLEDIKHDDAVVAEMDLEISTEAAKALYTAAKVALKRGNLEGVTEHALRAAVNLAEAL